MDSLAEPGVAVLFGMKAVASQTEKTSCWCLQKSEISEKPQKNQYRRTHFLFGDILLELNNLSLSRITSKQMFEL